MEHSGHLHPEFGLFSPTPRFRREMRIAATSVLFGGIAGALCVSGVIALRHSDRAAMEIAEARPAAPRTQPRKRANPAAARARMGAGPAPEIHAGTAARPPASAEVSAQGSSETSARRLPPSLPSRAWCGSGEQSRARRSREFLRAAAKRLQRPRRGDAPKSTQASKPPPPATTSRRPRRRKLASARAPGRPLPIRAAEEEGAKDGSHCQLSARRHRERSSRVTSGQMIGALSPPLRPAPMSGRHAGESCHPNGRQGRSCQFVAAEDRSQC